MEKSEWVQAIEEIREFCNNHTGVLGSGDWEHKCEECPFNNANKDDCKLGHAHTNLSSYLPYNWEV